tara:strand:- start:886 stop:1083 length:198 start_codon:yes stop_codon:yes gene_type:complete
MGYKKQAAKKNKEKKKERPKVVRSHVGRKYEGFRTDIKPSTVGLDIPQSRDRNLISFLKAETIIQ